MNFTIENETVDHVEHLDHLLDSAFGVGRTSRTVYRFRDGIGPVESLRFVALGQDRNVCGSIRFWPIVMPNGVEEVLLGPLAVFPDLRGQGIGKALVAHGLAVARANGYRAVLIVGDPTYYRPFGFREENVSGLSLPGPVEPLTFMGLEFEEGSLSTLQGNAMPRQTLDQSA